MSHLFDPETKTKWSGSTALVPSSSLFCLWCGDVADVDYQQPALFYHGGYGATAGIRVRSCRCGAINVVTRSTLNPRYA